MSDLNHFEKNFDYGSFLPLFLFIIGFYTIFNFVNENFSVGFFALIVSFIIYVGNNIYINYTKFTTVFNEYLEDMAAFVAFGVTIVIYGLIFFKEDSFILMIVLFYGMCLVLSMARNWVMKLKNSVGFPIALNGLFFPIFYYIYKFYLGSSGGSIFIFYFILAGFFTISNYNFLGYSEEKKSRFNIVDFVKSNKKVIDIEDENKFDIKEESSDKELEDKNLNFIESKVSLEKQENTQDLIKNNNRKIDEMIIKLNNNRKRI